MISVKTELFDMIVREVAVLECDLDAGVITWASPTLEAMFGYDPGELEGNSVDDLLPESKRVKHAADRAEFARHPATRHMGNRPDLVARRKDGTEFPVEVILIPGVAGPTSARRRVVVGIVFDMTSRRGSSA